MIIKNLKCLGYALLMVSITCNALSATAVQALDRVIPDCQLGFYRYIGGFLISIGITYIQGTHFTIPKESYPYMIRMVLTFLASTQLYFAAMTLLPVAQVGATYMSVRLISTALIKRYGYGRDISTVFICAAGWVTAGLFLTVQPWKQFSDGFLPSFIIDANHLNRSTSPEVLWTIPLSYGLAFLAAICEALCIVTYCFHLAHISSALQSAIAFSFFVPVSAILSLYTENQVLWISDHMKVLLIFIHVIAAALSNIIFIASSKFLDPVHITTMANTETLVLLIPQYTVFHGTLHGRFNIGEITGCILIVLSLIAAGLSQTVGQHEDFAK